MRMSTARRRVEKGYAFLVERLPGFRRAVFTPWLDLENRCNCVLGQVFGDYFDGRKILGLTEKQAHTLGLTDDSGNNDFATLTKAWQDKLA